MANYQPESVLRTLLEAARSSWEACWLLMAWAERRRKACSWAAGHGYEPVGEAWGKDTPPAQGGRCATLASLAGALLAGVSACAAPPDRALLPNGGLDGRYAGSRMEDPACGTDVHAVDFVVSGSAITVYSRHKHDRYSGTVGINGQITLQSTYGQSQIVGSIGNGQLTANETIGVSGHKKRTRTGLDDPLALQCTWHYQASRVPEGKAD